MSNKDNTANQGTDGSTTKNKGESQESNQKGAKSVSNNDTGKHKKDDSDGADLRDKAPGINRVFFYAISWPTYCYRLAIISNLTGSSPWLSRQSSFLLKRIPTLVLHLYLLL
jgi:hypothetical protein